MDPVVAELAPPQPKASSLPKAFAKAAELPQAFAKAELPKAFANKMPEVIPGTRRPPLYRGSAAGGFPADAASSTSSTWVDNGGHLVFFYL